MSTHDHTDDNKLLRTAATVVGAVFVLVGILGFVPGITSGLYDNLELFGHQSDAKLLGLFQVSVLHNIVHLLYGVAGLAMARRADTARNYLIGGGIVYLVLFVYGLLVADDKTAANFVPLNTADNWLHLFLGVRPSVAGEVGRLLDRRHPCVDPYPHRRRRLPDLVPLLFGSPAGPGGTEAAPRMYPSSASTCRGAAMQATRRHVARGFPLEKRAE
jgi:hypothetical protein